MQPQESYLISLNQCSQHTLALCVICPHRGEKEFEDITLSDFLGDCWFV